MLQEYDTCVPKLNLKCSNRAIPHLKTQLSQKGVGMCRVQGEKGIARAYEGIRVLGSS